MLDKLNEIEARLAQVEQQLGDPAVYSDRTLLRDLSRQQKELTPVVNAYRAYRDAEERISDAMELLADPELKALAQEELQQAREDSARLQEELKVLLLPRDPNDDKGVVLNSAFAVSAAFTFAGHLAFTMSFNGAYVVPVIIGKLAAGVCAVAVARLLYAKMSRNA